MKSLPNVGKFIAIIAVEALAPPAGGVSAGLPKPCAATSHSAFLNPAMPAAFSMAQTGRSLLAALAIKTAEREAPKRAMAIVKAGTGNMAPAAFIGPE